MGLPPDLPCKCVNKAKEFRKAWPLTSHLDICIYIYIRHLFVVLPFLILSAFAQPPTLSSGPTTRVLAIGRITAGTTREKIIPVMQQEVRDTVRLYLSGKIDQWFVRRDQNGVVFLLNVSTVDEARALLEKLPLGEFKLMEFDLIPLGPLTPLSLLIQETKAPASK